MPHDSGGAVPETPQPDAPDARNAMWDLMRVHAPVYRDEATTCFLLTRYRDVREVLGNREMWKDADRAEDGALVRSFKTENRKRPEDRNSGMIWMDDPDHARVRGPIALALNRRTSAARPIIARIVGARLDALAGRDRFDVLADYAVPISEEVIAAVLGVEPGDLPQFRIWAEDDMLQFLADPTPEQTARLNAAHDGFTAWLENAMAERRVTPGEDVVSDLVAAQAAGAPLSDSEIRVNCQSLLGGGNLTTADLVGSAIFLLLRNPGELAKLRADPGLVADAVEETLRMEPPADGTQRIAASDMDVGGCPVRARQVVAISMGAANRDPEAFATPHRFDITRPRVPHVSFGGGAHICVGASLARLEAQMAIAALLARYPDLRLAEPDAAPRWRPQSFFHGLEELEVLT
jgi:hypothetical protein